MQNNTLIKLLYHESVYQMSLYSLLHPSNKYLLSAYRVPDTVVGMENTVTDGVQNMPLWHKNYFELKAEIPYLPNSLFLISLPKELKKNSTVINPLTGSSSSAPHPDRLYHKTILSPIYSSKDTIIFPKSHLFSHKGPFSFHF